MSTPNSLHIQPPTEYRTHLYGPMHTVDLNTSTDSLDIESNTDKKFSSLQNYSNLDNRVDSIDDYNSDGPIFTSTTNAVTSEHVQELDTMCNLTNVKDEVIHSKFY